MGDIIFLTHRIPFPPNRGDKIRAHHLLKQLSAHARVHVGCFSESEADREAEGELAALAASYALIERTKPVPLAGIEALLSRRPVSLTAFHHSALKRWIDTTLARHTIDAMVVFSGQMGQYIPPRFKARVVVDLCDVDSAKFDAYGKQEGRLLRRLIDAREGALLRSLEAELAARADVTVLVSEGEAALLRARLSDDCASDIRVIGNGIDTQFFDPAAMAAHPQLSGAPGPHLVFTGQMDYAPNIAACKRVIEQLLPTLRRRYAEAMFHIVGRAPAPCVLRHDGVAGVRVWGEVADVRPFLAGAHCAIAPLTIARGVQNKVLEAMAMARPVVLSSEAADGIAGRDGAHFAIGRSDDELVAQISALLEAPDKAAAMGKAARAHLCAHQSWEAMLAEWPALVLGTGQGRVRDAA